MRSIRTLLPLALSAAMLALAAIPAHADVKDGVDAWQSGDYARAVAEWRPLALAGDADAQFNLAQAYKLGRGVSADLVQAEDWYRRAARQGHLQAEDNLGLILFTAGKRSEAMSYILRSAERGEPRAQYVLGTAMFNGDLVAKDWPRAYALTKRASDAGLAVASARLAQLDQLIPLDQRQLGLALLPQMDKDEARARLSAIGNAAPPPAAPPAPIVKTASVAPPTPGTSYAPPPASPTTKPTARPAARAATSAAAEATAKAQSALASGTPVTLPAAARPPRPRAPVTGPWRAQLGAFAVDTNARALWRTLAARHPAVAARTPAYVRAGAVTRLQAAGFASRSDAENFCATLRKAGQACLAVEK